MRLHLAHRFAEGRESDLRDSCSLILLVRSDQILPVPLALPHLMLRTERPRYPH